MTEFSLIDHFRRSAMPRPDVVLGIGDDAAVLDPPPGQWLVLAVDTLVEGVHFPKGTPASAIGWKALAVNLSDLAAMGAEPAAALLALTLPGDDAGFVPADFVEAFAGGFNALASTHRLALIGGDTTGGPLAASVTVLGYLPKGQALTRAGAQVDDDVWVTGTLGDAAGALALWKSGVALLHTGGLRERLDCPAPRVSAGLALRPLATACIDISDGFLADLGHVLAASGVGARIEVDALPVSLALCEAFSDASARRLLQLSGGDDYELCFTAPVTQREAILAALAAASTPVTRVGCIIRGTGLTLFDADGRAVTQPARRGYDHFAEDKR